jgi:hypothetical protein
VARITRQRPPAQGVDDRTPVYIAGRDDGTYAVVARDAAGVLHIEPPLIVPTRLRQRLYHCPCCQRPFLLTERSDGSATLAPFDPEGELAEPGDGW